MKESFLHFVWRTRRFDFSNLKTTEGLPVRIKQFGEYNTGAGADFTNARIVIDKTLWVGNVEMHLSASDWDRHKHSDDPNYENVILHVVLEEDQPAYRKNGERIPCIELKKLIAPKLSKTYLKLLHNELWIPCQNHFFKVSEIQKNMWFERLLVERLEEKTKTIEAQLIKNKGDWQETFYRFLARNFGGKINNDAFEQVADRTPLIISAKNKNSPLLLEALFFGQSGLLENDWEDAYPKQLKNEYTFLKKKYNLEPISPLNWKFLRLRPANFPTIRISQFCQLIHKSNHLFSKILEAPNSASIEKLFDIEVSDYWKTHYTFDKTSKIRRKKLGVRTIRLIIINTVVPFLFLYGKLNDDKKSKDKALQILEELKPEKNSIISGWETLGLKPESAYTTQALLQLKNNYCSHKKCLDCTIGTAILK